MKNRHRHLGVAIETSILSVLIANFLLSLGYFTALPIFASQFYVTVMLNLFVCLYLAYITENAIRSKILTDFWPDMIASLGAAVLGALLPLEIDYEWWVALVIKSIPFLIVVWFAAFYNSEDNNQKS